MELYPGFVFRFKILPLYKDVLRREGTIINLSPDEEENLKSFLCLLPERSTIFGYVIYILSGSFKL